MPSFITYYSLNEFAAKRGVKIIFTGNGGDEVLGGYLAFKYKRVWQAEMLKPFLMNLPLLKKICPKLYDFYSLPFYKKISPKIFDDKEKEKVLRENILPSDELSHLFGDIERRSKDLSILHKIRYYDLHFWTSDLLLTLEDRMSMVHSIESRAPLFDHKLVELSFNLSTHDLIGNLIFPDTKHAFRKVMKKYLPRSIIEARKRAMNVPLKIWFDGTLGDIASHIFEGNNHSQFFNTNYVKDLIEDLKVNRAWRRLRVRRLFALIVFEIYYKLFIEKAEVRDIKQLF